jgi:HSP20 family protein
VRGEEVRGLRLELGLSRERFAQLLGVSLQTVRRWEEGLSKPLPILNRRLEELEGERAIARQKARRKPEGIESGLGRTDEARREYTRRRGPEGINGQVKGICGFTVKVGTEDQFILEHFGNVQETRKGTVVVEVRRPLVDLLEEANHVVVVAELPGVERHDIRLQVKNDQLLHLSAGANNNNSRKYHYHKDVRLPAAVEAGTLESSYKNGVLEIKLRKK